MPIVCDWVTTPLHISYPFLSQNRLATILMTTTGGNAELTDRIWEKFKAFLERDKVKFGPLGVAASPPLASGWGLAGDGGNRNANNRARRSLQSQWGKIKEGIERGEDERAHARDFKQAL